MLKVLRRKSSKVAGMAIAAVALFSFAGADAASAHGYIEEPKARGLLCQEGANQDCGGVVWEPQSLEGPKGFPGQSVADGEIASAGGVFPQLDQQSPNRWAKVDLNSGRNTINWHLTARHSTSKWHYYITKPDWNPNLPLTRDQFELVPFYEVYDGGARPNQKVSHDVTIPERTGYHVILGVWDVADTANAFYNVIDVNFGGGTNPDPDPGEPDPDPDPGQPDPEEPELPDLPTWDPGTAYTGGSQVIYNGNVYQARWWTLGENPETSSYVWEQL
ncbi:lytic polysaccharide monooxygenase [Alkalihalobacillus sp. 1P02AB]|uniref:lytic polysaccharide monooxygenase n=1 Tax=Alkalihalobacillus sp. 1P02AB TaxID=3132260 RepID=UPI0039A42304